MANNTIISGGKGRPNGYTKKDYTVGWICALHLELAAAEAMLDSVHDALPREPGDTNTYVLGSIGHHNVVLTCLSSYGTTNAATAANNMNRTFPRLDVRLMVGIGGGVPGAPDVRLGDIVVGNQVVQYDLGKAVQNGQFQIGKNADRPPPNLGSAVATLRARHASTPNQILDIVPQVSGYSHPGLYKDTLYEASYYHIQDAETCDRCDSSKLLSRKARPTEQPQIHYGIIASGNQVMKDGEKRDRLASELDAICFEMEAAGFLNHFPCLVVRGISDYSDSHKHKEWQPYAAVVAAAYAKELLSVIAPSIRSTEAQNTFDIPFSLSHVPQVDRLVTREKELSAIDDALGKYDENDQGRRVAFLHGLGGMGKTQLAVAYAKRSKNNFSAIFWLNIKDLASLKSSFQRVAAMIRRAHSSDEGLGHLKDSSGPEAIIASVKTWLSLPGNDRWLLIFDNYDNPTLPGADDPSAIDIDDYLPEAYQGSVLITTRVADLQIGRPISLRKMEKTSDVLEMLSIYSGRSDLDASDEAMELIRQLDGLPLAIATAGSYLRHTSMTLSQYSKLYNDSWAKLQRDAPTIRAYNDRRLFSTWQISLDRVRRENPSAAELLRLWAYFDNGDIWFELLHHPRRSSRSDPRRAHTSTHPNNPDWFRSLVQDEISFSSAMRILCNYGLVEINTAGAGEIQSPGYSIHACVHSWATDVLNPEIESNLLYLALDLMATQTPNYGNPHVVVLQRRLVVHVLRFLDLTGKCEFDDSDRELYNIGSLLLDQGYMTRGEFAFKKALMSAIEEYGPDSEETLGVWAKLGRVYFRQRRYKEGEQVAELALQGLEQTRGPEDKEILHAVSVLADLYLHQSKLDAAESMYLRLLRGREKCYGSDHQRTLSACSKLANLYTTQKRFDKAEKLYSRSLQGQENTLGSNHPETLNTVDELGCLYREWNKFDLAIPLFERAIQGFEEVLGRTDPVTLGVNNGLGLLYIRQGRSDKAEEMYKQVLRELEESDNLGHPCALEAYWDLGKMYWDTGRHEEARSFYLQAWAGYTILEGSSGQNAQKLDWNLSWMGVSSAERAGVLMERQKGLLNYSRMEDGDKFIETQMRLLQRQPGPSIQKLNTTLTDSDDPSPEVANIAVELREGSPRSSLSGKSTLVNSKQSLEEVPKPREHIGIRAVARRIFKRR